MEEVKCPRCQGTGDIPAPCGQGAVMCFTCGGHGVIDAQDLAWKSKWAEQAKPARNASKEKKPVIPKKSASTASAVKAPAKKAVKTLSPTASKLAAAKQAAAMLAEESGRTPLHLDASDGFLRGVQELLDRGADVHARDKDGRTPLHWPAYRGHLEVVRLLIEHGADINARENNGRTPLKMATIGNHTPVIEFLKEHGAEM